MIEGLTEEEVCIKYEKLVYKMANKMYIAKKDVLDKHMDFSDILQASYLGLIHSYRSYDSSRGAKFITHAYICIPQVIDREIFTPRKIKAYLTLNGPSLDAPVKGKDGKEDTTFGDLLAGEEDTSIEDAVYDDIRVKLYNRLSSDEREILTLYNIQRLTFRDIGAIKGVSGSRIQQMFENIVNRLRVQYMRECKNV